MKRSILWGCFFFSILGLIFIQTGCDFFKNSPSGPSIVNSLADSSAVASVRFELVVPHKGDGTPLASIRGASNTSVTFRLVVARPGDTTRTKDVLVKSVAVGDDGSATVTFNNIPERPCVGQLSISNGNYQGYKDFHGALDLKEGENTIELAPAGSKLPQDILAHTAIVAFDSTELMQTANNALIQTINNSIIGIDATKDDVYTTSVNKAIEVLRPSTVTYFAISDDKKSLMGYANGVKNWENTTSDYFQSVDLWATNISDMYIKEIIRQNLGGVGYVAWKHSTLSPFAIGAITSSGSLQAFVKNPGVCEQILALSDGSVVIGGANDDKGCPVLFRWSGKENGSTWSNSGGAESGLIWYYYFTEQTFSGSGDRPTVKGLQFDGVDTLIVTVDNVEDNSVRTYRISLSSGSVLDQQTEKANEFPSVVLQGPANGATFSVGDEIVFEAVASDTDGTIAKVEFYAGNSKVGEATSKPYSYSNTSLTAGTYNLSAIAIDDKGAKTRSTFSEIVVNSSSSGGTTEIDLGDSIKMNFVPINAGSFTMGDADGFSWERPTRTVSIGNSFYMGKHEVTQAQYQKIMGINPSNFTTDDNLPVELISWYDAASFCNRLSTDQGLTPCYTDSGGSNIIDSGDTVTCNWLANGYRLPTEAEWEYCCRAGTTTDHSCGDTFDGAYGWYSENSSAATHIVGTKLPNSWGLYDMHGNVAEWCWDWFDENYYSQGENLDPRGPSSGLGRVFRGGGFGVGALGLRSAYRIKIIEWVDTCAAQDIGFRVLRLQNSNSVGLPASPSGLSATTSDGSVTLAWDSVSGANSYNIYYSTSSGVTKNNGIKLSGKTSPFIHSGLTNGTTYYYVVTAVNSAGESEVSVEKSATPSSLASNEFAGGTGVEGDPFLVENANQLDCVRKYPKSFFKQIADIDLSDFLAGNEIGWVPIGESYIGDSEFVGAFQGTYDGNNKKISNLRIDLPDSGFVGLFGFVCQSTVKNLTIESAQIKGKIFDNTMISSHEGIGILIGGAGNGIEVNNCHVSGSVYGGIAGALVGRCSTTEDSVNIVVQNSTSNATVNGSSNSVVGGLIGVLTGSVWRCSSSGIVNGGSAGGLIGTASNKMVTQAVGSTIVSECFSDADVSGSDWAGGLIGYLDYCSLSSSYAKGKVVGVSAGGLVGSSGFNSSSISGCYSTGSVEGSVNTGGLVGNNSGPISYSFSSSTVNTTGDYSGGLVGLNSGTISDSYSTGSVSGNNYVGGFCGRSYPSGYLFRCHSIGIVSGGVNQANVGGFCGKIFEDWQIVYDCFWDIEKSGIDHSNGGLGLTTANMKNQTSFVNWDFDITWEIKDAAEYPSLR